MYLNTIMNVKFKDVIIIVHFETSASFFTVRYFETIVSGVDEEGVV